MTFVGVECCCTNLYVVLETRVKTKAALSVVAHTGPAAASDQQKQ
jgi:hypothetical protein